METQTHYWAKFPMKYGDMATRFYKSKGIAIREAKKHLKNYQGCSHSYCMVGQVGKANPIFEMTTHEL